VPSRQALHAALEGLSGVDFGGVRVGYGKGIRDGNDFVAVAVVSADGRLTMWGDAQGEELRPHAALINHSKETNPCQAIAASST